MSSAQPRPLAIVPPENDGLTPMPLEVPGESPDTVDLNEVVSLLRRNLGLIAAIALLVLGAAASVVLSQPAQYRASALLRLKDVRGAMTAGLDDAGLKGLLMGRTTDPLLSEIEVLKSRAVAAEVVDREGLRLRLPEGFPAGVVSGVRIDSGVPADTIAVRFDASGVAARAGGVEARAAYGQPVQLRGVQFVVASRPATAREDFYVVPREYAIQYFMTALVARPREQTDVVDVSYTAASPEAAQRLVNSAVTVFQNLNLRLAQEHSRRRRIFIEEQLVGSDSLLAGAQLALSEFRRRENVYSSSQKFAAEQTTLQGLQVRREELVAERDMYASLLARVRRGGGVPQASSLNALVSAPGMAGNPVVTALYERLVRYGISRDSLTTGAFASADASPDVQRLDALIASTTADLLSAAGSHVESVQARITALDQLQARTSAVIQSLPTPEAEEVRLTLQMETVRKIADQLREEYQKARVAEVVEAGQVEVLAAAPVPVDPLPRRRGVKLALALVVGLLLGSAAAFVRDHMNSALHTREDVEKVFRAPALATIPQLPGGGRHRAGRLWNRWRRPSGRGPVAGLQNELVTATSPVSSAAEAYRVLRTNLIFSQSVRTLKTVVVTSSTPGEGKTTTAANLAVTFAQQGMQVLLVDCDLRRARLHRLFETHRDPGLTHLVLGHNVLAEVVQPTSVDGLWLLPSGALPPNPQELLGGPRMQRTLDELSSRYDLVVLDTPPLLSTADAAVLAARVDGVVMVVRAGLTDRQPAKDVADQLRSVDAHLLGVVLNDADDLLRRYGGYYGAYGYGDTE